MKSQRDVLLGHRHAPARVRHAPTAHSNAWEDVVDLMASLGTVLDSWQEDVLQAAMGERRDGTWSARQVGVSAPRQNGKSEIIVARALAGVLIFGEKSIVISAHQVDTAREVFNRIVDLIENNSSLERRVTNAHRAAGREYIEFTNGAKIRFKSRSIGSGRGFSCDCLLLDEAQILGAAAWSAILPTMSARPNPQVWLLGTPPTEDDDSEVFERIRQLGIDGKERRLAYLEWSAYCTDDISDPATWAKANPAYGLRIGPEAIATELASMSPQQFRCERLGIWPDTVNDLLVVTPAAWVLLHDVDSIPAYNVPPIAIGVSMTRDGRISIGACWHVNAGTAEESDLTYYIEEIWAGSGVPLAIHWLTMVAGRRIPVLIDEMSPAAQLIPLLKPRKVRVRKISTRDVIKGCLLFETHSREGTLVHGDQPRLTDSVLGGIKRAIGSSGGWAWGARDGSVSIHRAIAATWALLGAVEIRSSDGDDRRVRKAVIG